MVEFYKGRRMPVSEWRSKLRTATRVRDERDTRAKFAEISHKRHNAATLDAVSEFIGYGDFLLSWRRRASRRHGGFRLKNRDGAA